MNVLQRIFALFCLLLLATGGLTSPELAKTEGFEQQLQSGLDAMEEGCLGRAQYSGEDLLQKAKEDFGEESAQAGSALSLLTMVMLAQGEYEQAEKVGQRFLAICEKVYGPSHPETAACLGVLPSVYESQAKFQQAEEMLRRALINKNNGFGKEHPYTAVTASRLASVLTEQGEYIEAEKLFNYAVSIHEKAWAIDNPYIPLGLRLNLATNLEGLATLYIQQHRLTDAKQTLDRALDIRERLLGNDHSSSANIIVYQGDIYDSNGNFVEAEKQYRRALKIVETNFGSEHPNIVFFFRQSRGSMLRTGPAR